MQPNVLLDALLDEAGMSHAGLAAHVNQAGRARGLALRYEHTAVARWLKGQRPRGQVPDLICEVLGGRLRGPSPSTTSAWRPRRARRPRTPPRSPASSSGPPPCGAPTNSSARTPHRRGRHRHPRGDARLGVGEPARGRRRLPRAARTASARRHRDPAGRPRALRADVPQGGRRGDPGPHRRLPQHRDRPAAARQLPRRPGPAAAPGHRRPGGGGGDLRVRLRRARARPALLPPGPAPGQGERGPGPRRRTSSR